VHRCGYNRTTNTTEHSQEVDQTTHDVLLSCLQDPGIMRDVWQMQALNSISDITLRTILSAAKKDLVDNEHVTVEGKVFSISEFHF
jgi:hypothetical protein